MPEQTDLTPADTPPPAVGVTRFICWPGRRRADGGRDTPRLVCLSSRESYVANVPSLLGIAEVIGAVWLYWWAIPAWFDTHWHLLVSVLIAPLLLLRSPASIEAALDAFTRYFKNRNEIPLRSWQGSLIVAASYAVALALSYVLASSWLTQHTGWSLFWRSAVVAWLALNTGIVVAIAVAIAVAKTVVRSVAATAAAAATVAAATATATATAATVAAATATAAPSWAGGLLIRALTIKVLMTLRHPIAGLRRFRENWHRLVFAQDFRQPPRTPAGQPNP